MTISFRHPTHLSHDGVPEVPEIAAGLDLVATFSLDAIKTATDVCSIGAKHAPGQILLEIVGQAQIDQFVDFVLCEGALILCQELGALLVDIQVLLGLYLVAGAPRLHEFSQQSGGIRIHQRVVDIIRQQIDPLNLFDGHVAASAEAPYPLQGFVLAI